MGIFGRRPVEDPPHPRREPRLEGPLTPERLGELPPSQLGSLTADSAAASRVGKLVLGDAWYFAAVPPAADAVALQARQEELEGEQKTLLLRFSKGVDRDLPVTLESIGATENGRVVAVFRGTSYLRELTLLRQQSAEIITGAIKCTRVPK